MSLPTAAWPALGTTAVVVAADGEALAGARAAVEEVLAAVDAACSRFRDDSELQRVNRSAGRPVAVSPLLLDAVDAALWAAAATGGAVDPTVGRAVVVSGYDRDFALVTRGPAPRAGALRAAPAADGRRLRAATVRAASGANWRHVAVDRRAATVRIPPGVALDLGATAKALAAERAATAAAARTTCGVLVALGGDVAVAGPAPAGSWRVRACEDHRAGPDAPGQTITIRSGAVATSSTTVRRWGSGASAAHHIVDPATGRPAGVVWRTATVAAATCVEANAASTAAIVLGERAAAWLERTGLPARLVAAGGAVLAVGGWPAQERAA